MYVYLLTNKVNGKYYVGKTVHRNLNSYLSVKRWAARHGKFQGMPVVCAMAKYGVDNFSVDVLAVAYTPEELDELERLWIIALNSRDTAIGYNVNLGGSAGRLGMPCSEEHKIRIGAANRGRKPKGYVRTEEHRRQLRERMRGNKIGKKITPEMVAMWKATETPETKRKRHAAIKAEWDRCTPEQKSERCRKMAQSRNKGRCEVAQTR
jgi:group I intron endonuclease